MLMGKRIFMTVMALSTIIFTSPTDHVDNTKDKVNLPKYGFNWQVTKHHNSHRPGRPNWSQDNNKPGKPNKPERPDWSQDNNKPEKPNKPERPDESQDNNKPETPNKPERPDESQDNNKPEKPNKPERPDESQDNNKPETPDVSNANELEQEAIRLINIERSKAGLSSLSTSSKLIEVARVKSKDMDINNYFSHNSPKYGSPFDMLKSFNVNYNTAGENIAKGYSSAESVVRGWMNSSGHRDNILNPNFNTMGIGIHTSSNGTIIWTQLFTN